MFDFSKTSLFNQKRFYEEYEHKEDQENPSGSEYKNSFLEDLERITFCSSNRRMQDKAQVYPLEQKDFVRSRLTHSMEVSAVASSIGNVIFKRLYKKLNDTMIKSKRLNSNHVLPKSMQQTIPLSYNYRDKLKRLDTDLILCLQASSLLHDFGNPPFGHFGEDIIKKYFQRIFLNETQIRELNKTDKNFEYVKNKHHTNDLNGYKQEIFKSINNQQMINDCIYFDGNAQGIRIINELQKFNDKTKGLNLTYGVLGSLFKYPYSSEHATNKHQKFGYLYSENHLIETLLQLNIGENWAVFNTNHRNPLAIIMEAADDIACAFSDFEDCIQKDHVKYEDLIYIKKHITDFIGKQSDKENDSRYEESVKVCKDFINQIVTKHTELIDEDVFSEPLRNAVYRVMISEFKNNAIYSCADAFISDEYFNLIMTGKFQDDKGEDLSLKDVCSIKPIFQMLSKIKQKYVFSNKEVIIAELQGKKIIEFLLDLYLEAVFSDDFVFFIEQRELAKKENHKILQTISKNYISTYKETIRSASDTQSTAYYKIRLVIDHICSMTDSYARETYLLLNGIK